MNLEKIAENLKAIGITGILLGAGAFIGGAFEAYQANNRIEVIQAIAKQNPQLTVDVSGYQKEEEEGLKYVLLGMLGAPLVAGGSFYLAYSLEKRAGKRRRSLFGPIL